MVGHSGWNQSKNRSSKNFLSPILLIFGVQVPLGETCSHTKFFCSRTHILGNTGVQNFGFFGVPIIFERQYLWPIWCYTYKIGINQLVMKSSKWFKSIFCKKILQKIFLAKRGPFWVPVTPSTMKFWNFFFPKYSFMFVGSVKIWKKFGTDLQNTQKIHQKWLFGPNFGYFGRFGAIEAIFGILGEYSSSTDWYYQNMR